MEVTNYLLNLTRYSSDIRHCCADLIVFSVCCLSFIYLSTCSVRGRKGEVSL